MIWFRQPTCLRSAPNVSCRFSVSQHIVQSVIDDALDDGMGLKSEAPSLFFPCLWAPPVLTRCQKGSNLMALVNNQPFLVVSWTTVWSHADYRHPFGIRSWSSSRVWASYISVLERYLFIWEKMWMASPSGLSLYRLLLRALRSSGHAHFTWLIDASMSVFFVL